MDLDHFATQMATNARTIQQLTVGVSEVQARWKPDAETWSVLEVINHLADEERLDFRVRLDHILYKPGVNPPPIDPQGWVTEHAYNERQLEPSLSSFLQAREDSLAWLRGLDAPDWEAVYTAPWGSSRAGDMFAAWVAHDLLHMRQLVELHYAWTQTAVEPYQVNYAGEW
ncbi:MAG: DinB family protein [Anaerolineae bacterium]|nr:DinB family protein [Anaerolineae bacterium]